MRTAIRPLLTIAVAIAAILPASAQQPMRWLVIVDDYHVAFIETGRMRTQLKTAIDALIAPADSFSLHSTGPSRVTIDWTSDRSALDAGIRRLTGNALKVRDMFAIVNGQAPPDGRDAATAQRVTEILGALEPEASRTGVVYVSNGYLTLPPGLKEAIAAARIPFLVVDPYLASPSAGALEDPAQWEEYWKATRQSLRTLAEASDGVLLERQAELRDAAKRMRELIGR